MTATFPPDTPPDHEPAQAPNPPDGGRVTGAAQVPVGLAGARLDRAAAELFNEHSRAELTRWIKAGELTVDGAPGVPKQRLTGGEQLRLDGVARVLPDWQVAQAIDFEVLYADADLAVINKPAGLVVHPGAGQPDGTLVNGLLQRFKPAAAAPGEDPRLLPRAGIVHRLDKDTSGLMLVGRSSRAVSALTEAIEQRAVRREYLAVVEGVPTGGFSVEAPIGRHPNQRTRQAVVADGKYALTHVRVIDRYAAHALVNAQLATGRTHQIRVHLAHRNLPLVGDTRYGARRRLPSRAPDSLIRQLQQFPRQALHAWKLALDHPETGEPLEFTADLPDDMAALTAGLDAHARSA